MESRKYLPAALAAILICLGTTVFAQREIVWKGGTPGQEHKWECPQNWIPNQVPDEFSNVLIPDVSSSTFVIPHINNNSPQAVNSLYIESGGGLSIHEGASLTVHTYFTNPHPGNLQNKGMILIRGEHLEKDKTAPLANRD